MPSTSRDFPHKKPLSDWLIYLFSPSFHTVTPHRPSYNNSPSPLPLPPISKSIQSFFFPDPCRRHPFPKKEYNEKKGIWRRGGGGATMELYGGWWCEGVSLLKGRGEIPFPTLGLEARQRKWMQAESKDIFLKKNIITGKTAAGSLISWWMGGWEKEGCGFSFIFFFLARQLRESMIGFLHHWKAGGKMFVGWRRWTISECRSHNSQRDTPKRNGSSLRFFNFFCWKT